MGIIAPSLLEADYQCLGSQLDEMKAAGAEYVHLDVMDGNFVPNLSFGMRMIKGIRGASDLVFDVHMMVVEPERFLWEMCEAGADSITVHYEACGQTEAVLRKIKSYGILAGVALKPETPVEVLTEEILRTADVIHIMTVQPGLQGQKFQKDSLERISKVRKKLESLGLERKIEADGGIDFTNALDVVKAGVDIVVSGKALFDGNLEANIRRMKLLIKKQEDENELFNRRGFGNQRNQDNSDGGNRTDSCVSGL